MSELTPTELAGITAVMARAGTVPVGPLRGRLLTAGRSNLTYRLDDDQTSWVMRTPPRAGRTPSAHDVAREFRAIQAVGRTAVPVPPAVVLHEDEELLGAPFAISGFVDGRTIQTQEQLADLDDTQVASAIDALSAALAALHAVDHVAIGLERFGRPDAYAARQHKRWSGQWEILGDGFSPEVGKLATALSTALADRLPVQAETGIVHGDYRLDNTLVRVEGPSVSIAAIVDWELSTIGDPVADVANMCVYRDPTFDLIVGEPAAWTSDRMPSVEDLATSYEKAGGVPLRDFDEHLALAYFKLAVIAAGIDHRYRAGATHGEGFDTSGDAVPLLLQSGLDRL
ncbi:acyl-CoA dehydrogenase [Nocardioides sp. Root190]|uniref:phosphotransferase family protein n=1 Tax=Nocardioides sp. Root190 TaxID=1736488 RepID=UPI0006FEC1E5|nr:phosphotransferase family protein [Nocardioides sp. Root190]KRB77775.1 acyl-CoA dehydrogenase [Nocardioides sp. Root190]